MSKRIGLGLLGFGWIVEIVHLPALLGSRSLRLIAAAEQSPERRALLAKRAPGVRLHEDTKSLLEGHPRLVEHPPGRGARLMRGLQALRELHPARLLRSPGWEPSFQAALEAFGTAVAQGNPFEPDPEDGLYALAVVEVARASARNGGWSYDSASSYGGVGGLPIPLTGSDG